MKKIICFFLIALFVFSGCFRISRDELDRIEDVINSGNYSLAVETLSKIKDKYASDPVVFYLLGFSYLKKDDYNNALQAFKRTFDLNKNYSVMVGDISTANFLAGNSISSSDVMFSAAMREIDTILNKHPEGEVQDRIRYHKAVLLMLTKEHERAVQELQRVIENKFPSSFDSMALLKIGILKLDFLNQESEGLKEIQQVLELYSDSREAPEAMFMLADHRRKKAEMFSRRATALESFYKSWENVRELEKDRNEAKNQAREDRKKEVENIKYAVEMFDNLIKRYPNSNLSANASEIIKELNQIKVIQQ